MTRPTADLLPPAGLPTHLRVRVLRLGAGVPQWLFTYSGAVDLVVLAAVMHHVHHLAGALPGAAVVEVLATGLDGALLHAVRGDLRALRRCGVRTRLARRRRRTRFGVPPPRPAAASERVLH